MEKLYKKVGKKYIEVDQTLSLNQEIVLGSSVRYGLGRSSYVVGSICEELVRLEPLLSINFKSRISKEIQEYQDEYGKAGMDMDNDEWNYVKWLFDPTRRYIIEANKYNTNEWVEVEAVLGEGNDFYGLDGHKGIFHTVRNAKKK